MSKFIISSAVQSQLNKVAELASSAFVADRRSWEPVEAAFSVACDEADLPTDDEGAISWDSEGGKAVMAYIGPKVLAYLSASDYYDIEVHRVGSGDEYLPVDADHPANYTITGSFAISTDLSDYKSVKDAPRGIKAWLRGGANGERPDGASKGLRDLINNNKDQVLSRLRKKADAKRKGGDGGKDFADFLLGLRKAGEAKRKKYAKDHGDDRVVSEGLWSLLCDELASKAILAKPKAKAKS